MQSKYNSVCAIKKIDMLIDNLTGQLDPLNQKIIAAETSHLKEDIRSLLERNDLIVKRRKKLTDKKNEIEQVPYLRKLS